ncbi:BnaCnng55110D [Brassica napus]|uniref:Uncharacterized protein n=3 Tax=Brassica TaxID=3705 RepID=A0A0D3BXI6_BRAOL|nr:unnamed protein product [Brassica napus]CDY67465.1 BnaCnng55110D [Brassica napus]VDD09752.1 unnamed protein product [Brassica oleracea]
MSDEKLNSAFFDIGHSSMQVCIARFTNGKLEVLSHGFDRCLGGRDFDEVLFNHFAHKFKEEYKIDVYQNAKASLSLKDECEELNKVISKNHVVTLKIECLMDEKNIRGLIKREEFEEISLLILERVKVPLEKTLTDAGLSDVHIVEVVGSSSHVPAIIKFLTAFFGKEPMRTITGSESVARGALHKYISESEKETFLAKLQEVKDWLFEDGQDVIKDVYVAKLKKLQEVGDSVEIRCKEWREECRSQMSLFDVSTCIEMMLSLMNPSLTTSNQRRSNRS